MHQDTILTTIFSSPSLNNSMKREHNYPYFTEKAAELGGEQPSQGNKQKSGALDTRIQTQVGQLPCYIAIQYVLPIRIWEMINTAVVIHF